jgi:tubulin polyglutamylase TTLL6/13
VLRAVRLVQRKLGWKEVGDDEDWEVFWTDTSVSIERIIKLTRTQVNPKP